MKAGDEFINVSAGGGGWGSPLERDPRKVVDDVLNGLILPESASEIYGVDVAEDGSFLENFRRGQKRLIGGKSGPNSGLIPN